MHDYVAIGIIVLSIISIYIMLAYYGTEQPDNMLHYYGSAVGGGCTVLAAFIAYVAARKALESEREKIKQEQEAYKKILFTETDDVHLKLIQYVDYIKNGDGPKREENTKEARKVADSCKFDIPQGLYDYNVMSRLHPDTIEHAVKFRVALKEIEQTYFKSKSPQTSGMHEKCEQALKYATNAFGPRVYVPAP